MSIFGKSYDDRVRGWCHAGRFYGGVNLRALAFGGVLLFVAIILSLLLVWALMSHGPRHDSSLLIHDDACLASALVMLNDCTLSLQMTMLRDMASISDGACPLYDREHGVMWWGPCELSATWNARITVGPLTYFPNGGVP